MNNFMSKLYFFVLVRPNEIPKIVKIDPKNGYSLYARIIKFCSQAFSQEGIGGVEKQISPFVAMKRETVSPKAAQLGGIAKIK